MRWQPTPRHLDSAWKEREPLLYDWFGHQLRQIGQDVDGRARARFLEREIRRRAAMIVKHLK